MRVIPFPCLHCSLCICVVDNKTFQSFLKATSHLWLEDTNRTALRVGWIKCKRLALGSEEWATCLAASYANHVISRSFGLSALGPVFFPSRMKPDRAAQPASATRLINLRHQSLLIIPKCHENNRCSRCQPADVWSKLSVWVVRFGNW